MELTNEQILDKARRGLQRKRDQAAADFRKYDELHASATETYIKARYSIESIKAGSRRIAYDDALQLLDDIEEDFT